MQIWGWTKLLFRVTRRTKRYLTYVKGTAYSKRGCNVELQISEETARSKSVLANIKMPPSGSRSEEKETVGMNVTTFPAKDSRCP